LTRNFGERLSPTLGIFASSLLRKGLFTGKMLMDSRKMKMGSVGVCWGARPADFAPSAVVDQVVQI
jgi:hypothetical protein